MKISDILTRSEISELLRVRALYTTDLTDTSWNTRSLRFVIVRTFAWHCAESAYTLNIASSDTAWNQVYNGALERFPDPESIYNVTINRALLLNLLEIGRTSARKRGIDTWH